jgi:hypothetical protein
MKAALNCWIVLPPDRMDFRRHAAAVVAAQVAALRDVIMTDGIAQDPSAIGLGNVL